MRPYKLRPTRPYERRRTTTVPMSPETRALHSQHAPRCFTGGELGELYASILVPLGYIREHRPYWQPGQRYSVDFALVEEKICIEIDGKFHVEHPNGDAAKDAFLRSLGWKVIRIKEDLQ